MSSGVPPNFSIFETHVHVCMFEIQAFCPIIKKSFVFPPFFLVFFTEMNTEHLINSVCQSIRQGICPDCDR